jgi:predicted Zn-dependent protease
MNASSGASTGDLKTAVKHAMELLSAGESGLAKVQAEEILQHFPGEVNSEFVVAAALRAQGHQEDSLTRLQALTERAPDFALAQQELGFAYAAAGQLMPAIQALQSAVAIQASASICWPRTRTRSSCRQWTCFAKESSDMRSASAGTC